ncbi:hypothetical protein ARMGADRAFT_148988 [Armillaria gallica]|uniref:Uncharacterized protein n=1 Tax=Armillaria gallica TaxID=47427 RepID=A0A2H3E0B7_ARMGA|nr:hypothetical protein ARMGADRAFT_148988 [Armillaria gallica]
MTALVQIRPLDPGEEREVEEKTEIEEIGIGEPEIEEWRCNMREAIKTLDKFFSNIPPQATTSLELPAPPPQPQSRLDRLLPWRRPRQQDEEHQLTERV